MEKPEILFKRNYEKIKRICYFYSKYYNSNAITYEDLLSLAHESFMRYYYKYKGGKVSFDRYIIYRLLYDIKEFKVVEFRRREKENRIKVINNSFFEENYIKSSVKIKKKTKKLINDIISFLLLPDFKEKLKPFLINDKYNRKIVPEYAIKDYFIAVKKYNWTEIMEAFQGIKMILKEGII